MRLGSVAAIVAASAVLTGIAPTFASAACTRLAFSVNDYGKVGPTKDAKDLLDKYIAKWTAERNIAKYRTGQKTVTCELFLDFIVFDEYTCRAEASVCWGTDSKTVPSGAPASAPATQAAPKQSG